MTNRDTGTKVTGSFEHLASVVDVMREMMHSHETWCLSLSLWQRVADVHVFIAWMVSIFPATKTPGSPDKQSYSSVYTAWPVAALSPLSRPFLAGSLTDDYSVFEIRFLLCAL